MHPTDPMCRVARRLLAIALVGFAGGIPSAPAGHGDDEQKPAADSQQEKAGRAARLEAMKRRAASLAVKRENRDLGLVDAELIVPPLLSYNNHANLEIDATLWAWGKTGRPVAVAALHEDRGPKKYWSCEMVSLADGAVSIAGKTGWDWSPARSEISWRAVPSAPVAGKTAVARSGQIKDIAGRFTSTGHYRNGNVVELRLMGRPLHRYAEPDGGLVDGALLAFAEGTNPETLLLIECRSADGKPPAWFYGFTRMSGGRLVARLDDAVVWECPDVRGFEPQRAYSSINGPEDEVFGPLSETAEK